MQRGASSRHIVTPTSGTAAPGEERGHSAAEASTGDPRASADEVCQRCRVSSFDDVGDESCSGNRMMMIVVSRGSTH